MASEAGAGPAARRRDSNAAARTRTIAARAATRIVSVKLSVAMDSGAGRAGAAPAPPTASAEPAGESTGGPSGCQPRTASRAHLR